MKDTAQLTESRSVISLVKIHKKTHKKKTLVAERQSWKCQSHLVSDQKVLVLQSFEIWSLFQNLVEYE